MNLVGQLVHDIAVLAFDNLTAGCLCMSDAHESSQDDIAMCACGTLTAKCLCMSDPMSQIKMTSKLVPCRSYFAVTIKSALMCSALLVIA